VANLDQLWAGWRSDFLNRSIEAGRAVGASEPAPAGETGGAGGAGDEGGDAKGCVFCRILASGLSDEALHIVWRHPAGKAFVILNAYPYTSGHVMVMPVRHVSAVEELGPDEGVDLWGTVVAAVRAIKSAYQPEGVNLGANLGRAAGAGVPGHFHMHVVPRWFGDTNFMTSVANARVLPEALDASAAKLRASWLRE